MKLPQVLLGLAIFLGLGVFIAIVFVLPNPGLVVLPQLGPAVMPPVITDNTQPIPEAPPKPQAVLSFAGDIMLSRTVESTIVSQGPNWPFAKLGDLFAGSDLVIGNFEGTVRPVRRIEIANEMTFDTTPDNVEIVKNAGFTHVSLANNHADDYGPSVAISTREAITAHGLVPFGDPYASQNFIARQDVNGIKLSIIGFHAFLEDPDAIVTAIQAEKAADQFVIVYPHWGVEYETIAPANETYAAEVFINAGADLIVGAHPHVVQNIEVINGTPVIYSLGNFLFDQDFSKDTQQGLTAQVTITDETLEINFTPVRILNKQTYPMEAAAAQILFERLEVPLGTLSVPRK